MSDVPSGPVGFILTIFILIVMWFLWLGKFINDAGAMAIANGQLDGIWAFFAANINVVFFCALLLGVMGYLYFGGSR